MIRTVAVVTDDYRIQSQTFVKRHVHKLFGGRTVLVQTKHRKLGEVDRPLFSLGEPRALGAKLREACQRLLQSGRLSRDVETEFRAFVEQHEVDFILAEFGYVGLRTYQVARALGIPMFCYFRGADASRRLTDRRYVQRLREMMPAISGIVAVSGSLIENLRAVGVEHPETHVIPSGVDCEVFRPGVKEAGLVVAVGRFVAKKAPDVTIRAFAQVARERPHLRLEMVGEGELLDSCRALAEQLGVSARVFFRGQCSHEVVGELLGRAQVFMQHSITTPSGDTEGFPTSVQEAMACGAVVVTTRHAGIPDHVTDGRNGFLVNEHDFDGYVAALSRVISTPELCHQMAAAAREYAVEQLEYRVTYARLEGHIERHVALAREGRVVVSCGVGGVRAPASDLREGH